VNNLHYTDPYFLKKLTEL